MKLFKYNNPETYADELAPLSKELCLLKNGNKYTVAIKNEVDILSSGSYIPLDPETNLDYQRRYYDFVPIYPNYYCKVESSIDESHIVIKSYVRVKGYYAEMLLSYVEEKIKISDDVNLTIAIQSAFKSFTEKCYLVYDLNDPNLINDPNQESEQERVEAIYKP